MITPYIRQIQSLYFDFVPHYKQNVRTNGKRNEAEYQAFVTDIETKLKIKLPEDLIEFLRWSSIMPIWKAPFYPFTDTGKDFYVWSIRTEIIQIYLDRDTNKDKLVIMKGFINPDSESKLFFIMYVDALGVHTGTKNAIFVEYGKEKKVYADIFDDPAQTTRVVLADNIEQLLKKYVAHLQSLPRKEKVFKKAERLLNDPKKLFKYVFDFNWDDGEEEMAYVVKDPRCDLATALLVYWSSEPYFSDDQTIEETQAIASIVEKNIRNNFYKTSENVFNPASNKLNNFIKEYESAEVKGRKIPDFMLELSV